MQDASQPRQQAGSAEHDHDDARVDEQGEESFPASDAPASWAGADRPAPPASRSATS